MNIQKRKEKHHTLSRVNIKGVPVVFLSLKFVNLVFCNGVQTMFEISENLVLWYIDPTDSNWTKCTVFYLWCRFAADIFHDLHEQVISTSARGRKVMTRVKNIEAALPSLEKAIRGQTSHIHLAYMPGNNFVLFFVSCSFCQIIDM
jgi:hypothetical protein